MAPLSAWELQLLCGGFTAALALFGLAVWMGRPRVYANVLFASILVFGIAWTWNFPARPLFAPRGEFWFEWLMHNCMAWQLAAANFYWAFLHGRRRSWIAAGLHTQTSRLRTPSFWRDSLLDRVVVTLCVVVPLATLPGTPLAVPATATQLAIGAIALAVGIVETRHSVRGTGWEAPLFAAAYWITLLFALADWMRPAAIPAELWLLPFSPFVLALAIGASIARNLVTGRNATEQLTANLERQLRSREAELAESYVKLRQAERLQTLSEERRRLTQDMHDGLGSSLVSALRVVEDGRMSKAELEDVLRGCIDDLKLTIDSMEPVEADLLLLLATLRFRLEPRLTSAGVALRWEIVDVPKLDWLDPRNALHILRILQEAFANVLKHTRATEIRVTTGAARGWVSVTIADNGAGFDVAAARRGKGLDNQQRRAAAIGAEVALHSAAAGTRLTLRLPETRNAA